MDVTAILVTPVTGEIRVQMWMNAHWVRHNVFPRPAAETPMAHTLAIAALAMRGMAAHAQT
jgi:hypothetical protein